MRQQLTNKEMEKMKEQVLHIPMSKEEVAIESDIIEEEGRKRESITFDI